jgi:DNA-binding NarL/FixJ family response regulator
MHNVLILEDDLLTRLSIESAVVSFGFKVIFSGEKPTLALKPELSFQATVAILDLHLGKGPTGVDVAKELRRRHSNIGIVFLTSYGDPRLLSPSYSELPNGSVYLVKNKIADLQAIREAINQSIVFPFEGSETSLPKRFGKLSDTQIETLRLVAQGLSNAEIAKTRYITEKSVEVAISRVAKILGVEVGPESNQRVRIVRAYFNLIGLNL